MPVLKTTKGTFNIEIQLLDIAYEEDATGIQIGGDFTVKFRPYKVRKVGILQLIRPLTDVGAYSANRTNSGWAVDKHRAQANGASSEGYKLIYGAKVDLCGQNARFGINGAQAEMRDTPKEILSVDSPKIGQLTKFVNYAVNLDYNRIYNEGLIWGYYASENPDLGFTMRQQPPRSVKLKQTNEHKMAIAHFLNTGVNEVAAMIEE